MKWIRAIVTLLLAGAAFWALDNRHGMFPALGKLLDPFSGFWQNGEGADALPGTLRVPGLRGEVRVVWDDRRVPHIFAGNDHDLFLAQGYVAATLRLWQMDFQSLYTAGRISEVVGPATLRQDIFTRRFGLPWAAANAARAFRDDARTKEALDAFAAGVNARIADLGRKGLPVEFKILDYRPGPWSDYTCALLLKAMANVLTSYNQDAAMTRMKGWGGGWAGPSRPSSRTIPLSSIRSCRREPRSTSRRSPCRARPDRATVRRPRRKPLPRRGGKPAARTARRRPGPASSSRPPTGPSPASAATTGPSRAA